MGSAASKVPVNDADAARTSMNEKRSGVDVHDRDMLNRLSALSLRSPSSSTGALTDTAVQDWEAQVAGNPKLQLSRTILNHTHIQQALQSRAAHIADKHVFNTEIEFKPGPVTNQKSSGRCWLFASTNVLRYNVMKKLSLSDFQLSQVRRVLGVSSC